MECDRMRDWIEPYAAGRLAAEEAERLETHLKACSVCARELRWAQTLKAAVRALPGPAIPDDLRTDLLRQARAAARPGLGESLPGKNSASWIDSLSLSWRMVAGLGFASAFAAAAAIMLFRSGSESLTLDEVLAAHSRYELTMPGANREAIYADLGRRLAGEDPAHD